MIGTAFALHWLWAARWLAGVDCYDYAPVASAVLAMRGGLTVGAAVIGVVADPLRRHGVRPAIIFGLARTLFIGLQLAGSGRLPVPFWLLWGTLGGFGSMTCCATQS